MTKTTFPIVIEQGSGNRIFVRRGLYGDVSLMASPDKHARMIEEHVTKLIKDALRPVCECGHGYYFHYGVGLWPRKEGGHCSYSCGNRDPGCDCKKYKPKEGGLNEIY